MKIKRTAAIVAATTASLCVIAIVAGPGAAAFPTQKSESKSLAQNTQDGPVFTVENYVHPEADRLGEELGIKLKDGNGNMIYVECTPDGSLIRVESIDATGNVVCFQATGSPAWLNMEITGSFGVQTGQKPVDVTSTLDGKEAKMTVPKNSVKPVGVADGESVVVQLKVN
ncbi:hypothetical protein SAMN04489740_4143 [Arthrobacter alpinus]|uniref:Secreted protein n=1 Tax=Arthrobacter alpinus TaxID=656366 RepID=A0A1H5PDJ5_9MICC|nr:hypothetical protein [Arthrobacter alpinus]SEF11790.1 hypothetical protein SAMN04489740_4143 [Arthrobacter alpinus]